MNKVKIIFISIIVILLILLSFIIFSEDKKYEVIEQESITYKDASYTYKVISNGKNKEEINLMIESDIEIDSVKFPDNTVQKYNKKNVTLKYSIEENGIYLFFITYKNGDVKVVKITINDIQSDIEIKDENENNISNNGLPNLNGGNIENEEKEAIEEIVKLPPAKDNIMFKQSIDKITNEPVVVSIVNKLDTNYDIEYKIDDGDWTIYNGDITVTENCSIYARYKKDDVVSDGTSIKITNIDKEKPIILMTKSSESLFTKDIIVNVMVSDDSETINYYYWSQDDSLETIPKKKKFKSGQDISLSGKNGDYYLYIMSTDEAGNMNMVRSQLYHIDNIGPIINVDNDGTDDYVSKTFVTLSVEEATNTTNYYAWSKNRRTANFIEDNIVENGGTIEVSGLNGIYFLHIKSIDEAGNETYFVSNIFYFDNIAPEIVSEDIVSGGKKLKLDLNVKDNHSTSFRYYYSKNNIDFVESGNSYIYTDLELLTDHILYYKVVDQAGNERLVSFNITTGQCGYDLGDAFIFSYTGSSQSFSSKMGTVCSGRYKIEIWGAQGGFRYSSSYGGRGGYASATLSLNENQNLYVYVGASGNNGGWNGGGSRERGYPGGGGATDVRTVDNGSDWSNTVGLNSRLLVAGGGGSDGATNKYGGYGGGLYGESAYQSYGSGGGGGSQTSGGYGGNNNSGTFGIGGRGLYRSSGNGGAGGGGWYGGGGVYPDGSGDDDRGGGGGSGFVLTNGAAVPSSYLLSPDDYKLTDTILIAGNETVPTFDGWYTTGNSGNGNAKVTYLGE